MGREWDGWESPAAFQRWCLAWATECLRVLKPGGYLLAFGGTRTWHRLVCGIEDAGFEIRDSVASLAGQDAPGLMWIHGQGFPKSHDVAKAIDKAGGISPEVQGAVLRAARERAGLSRAEVADRVGCKESSVQNWEDGRARASGRAVEYITPSPKYRDALADLLGYTADERRVVGATVDRRGDGTVTGLGHSGVEYGAPVTEEAARWSGWGTALKPAWEPIVVARKPLVGTVAQNVIEHGTGALNIGGCRVGATRDVPASLSTRPNGAFYSGGIFKGQPGDLDPNTGRWPPNVLLAHSASCEQIGVREVRSGGHHPAARGASGYEGGLHGQSGLAERKSGTETVETWRCADDCPVAELDRQSGVLTSGMFAAHHADNGKRAGTYGAMTGREHPATYGDTGGASRFFPVFRYEAKAPASERPRLADGTAHPTVKPLGLMRFLVRLVTQPDGTVLDPFAGSGTTGEACIIEGFRCILVEKDPASAELIKTRLSKPIQPDLFGGAA